MAGSTMGAESSIQLARARMWVTAGSTETVVSAWGMAASSKPLSVWARSRSA